MPSNIPKNISDDDLLVLLHSGDRMEEAFGFLVDRYSPQLYNIVRRIVFSHDDTDDILQNVFVKVWKNVAGFRGASKLSTWLYSIATNEALSFLRKEKREQKIPLSTEEYDLATTLESEPYFDGDELMRDFMVAIDKLPEKQKVTFELRYFEEMPYNEISEITGTSTGALKANYHHAVKKLQKFLGIESEGDVD
ncbi:MAG: RNA polymerase sigma factor [Porphyromonas sp.]|nr:RNA polymerase sigma factor [Bacteroidales bacterium]MDD7560103.1 RNA polymerase sigma factor [Bacteroidales bacterium]MDY3100874.1 RNA polymerase sigma factor [Porphyromonas sp.]